MPSRHPQEPESDNEWRAKQPEVARHALSVGLVAVKSWECCLTVLRQPKRRILPAGLGWVLIAVRPMVVADGEFMRPKSFPAKAAFGFASQWFRWPGAAEVMAGCNHLLTWNLWRRTGGSKRQIAGFGGGHIRTVPRNRPPFGAPACSRLCASMPAKRLESNNRVRSS